MTVKEAISYIDTTKPNGYSIGEKIRWLNELDSTIQTEIVNIHEGAVQEKFVEYTEDSLDRQLIAMLPYDNIYTFWLEAKIDYTNGEYARYNNVNAMFATAYAKFVTHYKRTHKPKPKKFKFF